MCRKTSQIDEEASFYFGLPPCDAKIQASFEADPEIHQLQPVPPRLVNQPPFLTRWLQMGFLMHGAPVEQTEYLMGIIFFMHFCFGLDPPFVILS